MVFERICSHVIPNLHSNSVVIRMVFERICSHVIPNLHSNSVVKRMVLSVFVPGNKCVV